ncbi:MAG TPA: glycosyltransferase family 1 protein, partial [Propionibacteriaceae bacterium]
MIIALDATTIGSGLGGDETLVLSMLRGLAATIQPEDQVLVLAAPGVELPPEVTAHPGFRVDRAVRGSGLSHYAVMLPGWLRDLVARGPRPDVAISLTHAPLRSPVPVAHLVTDLSFVHVPDAYPWRTRFRLQTLIRAQIRRAPIVLTISEFCRDDLVASYRLAPERVKVIPIAIDAPRTPDPAAQARLADRGVRAPYLLYLGNLHPRKNVPLAISAFRAQRAADPRLAEHRFVVAGRKWFGSDAEARAAKGAGPDEIVFLDRVDDAEREVLLRDAEALVYLSTFEGFGLPPLEAMARDTVVLASDVTAVPEVCADAAVLVDPTDRTQIESGLSRVLTDADLRAQLLERGRARVGHYDV